MQRRDFAAGLATSAATLVALAAGGKAAAADSAGLRLAQQFAATLSAHDLAGFEALFADDYEQHQPLAAAAKLPAGVTAKQTAVRYFAARLAAFPDLQVTADPIVADASMVAGNFIYSGTHSAEYFGVPATGRRVTFNSTDIWRVRDGRFVAHWEAADINGLLQQLKG